MELREHIDSLATGEPRGSGGVCLGGGDSDSLVGVCCKDHPALVLEGPPREGKGVVLAGCCSAAPPPELCRINEDQKVALDLDPYVKKLLNARRRVVLVNNILQNAQVGAGLAARPLWAGLGIKVPERDSLLLGAGLLCSLGAGDRAQDNSWHLHPWVNPPQGQGNSSSYGFPQRG